MDLRQRRSLLSSAPNPDPRLDYVVTLRETITASVSDAPLSVRLRYVPDRLILVPESLKSYLLQTGVMDWSSLEEFAVTVLNDVNDDLIARWIEVSLHFEGDGTRHEVVLEERQPQWQEQDILSRLPNS